MTDIEGMMTTVETILKMTPEERKEESRHNIMVASWELFLEKGYNETTTRDIIRKAGILNGSLYNRFKSKEEILLAIFGEALEDCLKESSKFLKENEDPLEVLCMPMAVELYLASKSKKLAGLLYSAHQSWKAVDMYVEVFNKWAHEILDPGMVKVDDEGDRLRLITTIGGIGNICGMYANGFTASYRSVFEYMLRFIGPIMDMRVYELTKIVDSLCNILESSKVMICGNTLDEILEYDE